MNSLVPAKIERVWVVDAHGTAVEKKAQAKPLTSGQRHYHYRLGLMAVNQFLRSRGFSPTTESSTVLGYEMRGNVWIDIAIKAPERIAYVTSYVGYEYDPEKVRAKVVTAKDMLNCKKVIQVIASDRTGTHKPVYIPLPDDLENPSRHVATQVIATLSMLCDKVPGLREAFSNVDPNIPVPNELLDPNFLHQLPEQF